MVVMSVLAGVSARYDEDYLDYLADVFGIEKANVLTYIKSNIFT